MNNSSKKVFPVRIREDVLQKLEKEAERSPVIDSRSEVARKVLTTFVNSLEKEAVYNEE